MSLATANFERVPGRIGYRRVAAYQATVTIGIGTVILCLYAWVGWIGSADFHRVVPSSDADLTVLFWVQLVSFTLFLGCGFYWIVWQWVRNGAPSLLGLLSIANCLVYVYDPLFNYIQFNVAYNNGLVSYGSWSNFLPGFVAPNQQLLPENALAAGGTYIWFNVGYGLLFAWIWRKSELWAPRLGAFGIIVLLFVVAGLFDAIQEVAFLRTGTYAYLGGIRSLSLWPDHYYKFPIYQGALAGLFIVATASLIHYRDDQGYSWVEHGIASLKVGASTRVLLRLLSLTGAMTVVLLVTFEVPIMFISLHASAFPADTPRALINGICGEGSRYSCPGPGVPIPRKPGP